MTRKAAAIAAVLMALHGPEGARSPGARRSSAGAASKATSPAGGGSGRVLHWAYDSRAF